MALVASGIIDRIFVKVTTLFKAKLLEIRHQFGEFCRVNIGEEWYRISEFTEWRLHLRGRRFERTFNDNPVNSVWASEFSENELNNDNFCDEE